jgi:hypothetical protein
MTIDATQVTGSPHAGAGARPGDVLAERYELLEAIDVEGPSVGYRALDQETERTVLVRTLVGAPLDPATLTDSVERLKALVGAGGRHLAALLDADREGRRPFTVEAWPRGTQLSVILQARRARGEPLGPREVLPIAAQLAAALAALPRGWHHGDVRAERVFVDTDGLRLTGAFLLSALPGRALADRMGAIGPAAVAYAPEQASGRPSAASDRWGAAALIWEALTLRAPDRTSAPRELSPGVLTALRRLLDPEPGRRPADLNGLLEALARQAGMPVPSVDPAATPPRPATSADATGPRASADDTSKQPAVTGALDSSEDGLDPRLVRAALGITMESVEQDAVVLESDPGLDPRLVRAALGVVSEESAREPSLEELSSVEELLSSDEEELALDDEPPAPAPALAKPRPPVQAAPAPKPAPAPSPAAVQHAAPPKEAPRRAAQGHDGGTAVIPRPVEPPATPRPARRTSGVVIVVGALILAVLIVGVGFLVRALLSQERSSAERSRQIQERLEQIRGEEASPR